MKIRLHADALFTGRSAKLSGRAGALLDETAQEIKTKAMRPLTIVGHTDGRGDDSDNLKLSEERAEAVMKAMKSRLGGDFTYTTSGKGEAEPVAEEGGEDDAKARARNARVEIAYQVKRPADAVPNPPGGPSANPPGGPSGRCPGRPACHRAGRAVGACARRSVRRIGRRCVGASACGSAREVAQSAHRPAVGHAWESARRGEPQRRSGGVPGRGRGEGRQP